MWINRIIVDTAIQIYCYIRISLSQDKADAMNLMVAMAKIRRIRHLKGTPRICPVNAGIRQVSWIHRLLIWLFAFASFHIAPADPLRVAQQN
jgi:hypothetical protein